MFENFDSATIQVIVLADSEAQRLGQNSLSAEHLLLSLANQERGDAAQWLHAAGMDAKVARRAAQRRAGQSGKWPDWKAALPAGLKTWLAMVQSQNTELPFDEDARIAIEQAATIAGRFGSQKVQPEHLLAGLLAAERSSARSLLTALGIESRDLQEQIDSRLAG
ncbi:Clp protease N-terminal domain-containing protein [Gloeobacter kilaueensis]|uniref:ATPase n=1 Tax=Gloeobacter kilaueensis (strain ATCC BAA-2537 / CCAP 1431/1 / ULC 316 / JS1) TaxID=1183438 RepID=U5QN27_GLOK1|nr:Clp protease N-terminal domain-containing protein [Gloeobacter kilaueensis]AGY59085.1 ATPase [Gloeobacter kilaueensis JS1]